MSAQLDTQQTGDTVDAVTIAVLRHELGQMRRIKRRQKLTLDHLAQAVTQLKDRVTELEARNRRLAAELDHLPSERHRRSRRPATNNVHPQHVPWPAASTITPDERRRLGRDLHDGVQNELVALMIKLKAAEEDSHTPPALAATLALLGTRVEATLHSVREIGRGIYPPTLADFGIEEALRAQSASGAIRVRIIGAVPRSTDEAEAAMYFSCSEAIQNAAKHAGPGAELTLHLHEDCGTLTARAQDDGRGFDPTYTPEGAGLENIRDRITATGGTVDLAASPGHGTVVTMRLPWRHRQSDGGMPRSANRSARPSISLIERHDRIPNSQTLE